VARRLVPGSLRAQLALVIALVTVLAVGASFIALYNGTSARLQAQIDSQLRTQLAEWRQLTARSDLSTPGAVKRTAAQFIAGQRYHAESLLILLQVAGGPTVSNNAELLAAEEARERSEREATGLLNSPSGLATAYVAEAGSMRVLATPIDYRGRRVGTLRVANPLTPVKQAQASLRRTFLIVGAVALLLAIAAGVGLASLIAAPLRRMARVAAAVDAGELSMRSGPITARGEVRVLSDAFDTMLDRLERGFSRQRGFVSDASHELRTPLSCSAPRSNCSIAKPTSSAAARAPRRCCAAWMSSTGSSATC
jgi:HAMP domain-containing protein